MNRLEIEFDLAISQSRKTLDRRTLYMMIDNTEEENHRS